DPGVPRVEVLRDPHDGRALARGVAPLENHHHPVAGLPEPGLHLDQLRLQPLELALVGLLRQLLQTAGHALLLLRTARGTAIRRALAAALTGVLLAAHGPRLRTRPGLLGRDDDVDIFRQHCLVSRPCRTSPAGASSAPSPPPGSPPWPPIPRLPPGRATPPAP